MSDALYHDILEHHGFECIGQLAFRLQLSIWWNAQKCVQILLMKLGTSVLIKGERSYYLVSSAERETWARDIGQLHGYLETHFPEIRIAFAHFRDVPASLAQREAERELVAGAPTRTLPTIEKIARLQREFTAAQRGVGAMGRLLHLSSRSGDLLSGYVQQQSRSEQPGAKTIQRELEHEQQRYGVLKHLQREYQRKGSAAVFTFSISSNLQIVEQHERFADALGSVVAELTDYDRYQIQQKMQGGRLKIQVAHARQPVITWIEQWLGGALSPQQLARLGLPGQAHNEFVNASSEHVMVTPDEPIVVDGVTTQAPKHIAAHVLGSILRRIDDPAPTAATDALDGSQSLSMRLQVGYRTDAAGATLGPAILPMTSLGHTIATGTTGSGKSFFSRVLVEEAFKHTALKILILDPRNQFSGLLVREDRPAILDRYPQFEMRPEDATGFSFKYVAPESSVAPGLPANLSSLSQGRWIVSFKHVDETRRCSLAADILNAAFDAYSRRESDHPRMLIVVDEAQLLTQRRVSNSAAAAAARSEQALDQIAREGRKYGVCLLLVTQSFKSFSYNLSSLRQLAATKVFLRNSDGEVDYAADLLPDPRALINLPTAVALMHNAAWGGVHRIYIRPPLSKVCELSEEQLRRALHHPAPHDVTVSAEAKSLLSIITAHAGASATPLNLTQLAAQAKLTSRRRLNDLIGELEGARLVRTHRLPDRGKPRIVELVTERL